jgi:hypothetical protein
MNFDQSMPDNQLTMSSLAELPSLLRRILDSSRFQVHEKPFDDLLKIYDHYNYDVQRATEQYFYEQEKVDIECGIEPVEAVELPYGNLWTDELITFDE